jgi:hypothetical protein
VGGASSRVENVRDVLVLSLEAVGSAVNAIVLVAPPIAYDRWMRREFSDHLRDLNTLVGKVDITDW